MSIEDAIQNAIEDAGIENAMDVAKLEAALMDEIGKRAAQSGADAHKALAVEFASKETKLRTEGCPQAEIEALRQQYQDRGLGRVPPGIVSVEALMEIAAHVVSEFRADKYRA
jgi:hypothetical protein